MLRIGIDVGGTKVNIGLIKTEKISEALSREALSHESLSREACSHETCACETCACETTPTLIAKEKYLIPQEIKKQGFLEWTVKCLAEFIANNNLSIKDIDFIGMGLPGTISADGKRVLIMPNLGLEDNNVADRLTELLDNLVQKRNENISKSELPDIRLVQDSRAAAWGEYMMGAGQNMDTVVCVTLGTGIGTGIVMDGKIYNGAIGAAGETGHIPAGDPEIYNRKCACGRIGCTEIYTAGKGLDMTASELIGEGATAYELFELAKSASSDDPKVQIAREKINEAVKILGRAMIAIINIVSPSALLFSGGLCRQTELYLNPLIDYVKTHCYPVIEGKFTVCRASLGEDSPMIGAALLNY